MPQETGYFTRPPDETLPGKGLPLLERVRMAREAKQRVTGTGAMDQIEKIRLRKQQAEAQQQAVQAEEEKQARFAQLAETLREPPAPPEMDSWLNTALEMGSLVGAPVLPGGTTGGAMAAEGLTGIPAERIKTFLKSPGSYGITDLLGGIEAQNIDELVGKFPQAEEQAKWFKAAKEMSHMVHEARYPEGATEDDYAKAMDQLMGEVTGEHQYQHVKGPEDKDALRNNAMIDEILAQRRAPGIHSPPYTDAQIAKEFEQFLESGGAQSVEEFQERFPIVSTVIQAGSELPAFMGGMALSKMGMGALSKAGQALKGTKLGKGLQMPDLSKVGPLRKWHAPRPPPKAPPGRSAMRAGTEFAATGAMLGARDVATGRQEEFDASTIPKSFLLGAAGAKAGDVVTRILKGKKFSPKVIERFAGAVELGSFAVGEEAIAELERSITGEEDPEALSQKVAKWATIAFGGALMGKFLRSRAVERTKGRARALRKEVEKLAKGKDKIEPLEERTPRTEAFAKEEMARIEETLGKGGKPKTAIKLDGRVQDVEVMSVSERRVTFKDAKGENRGMPREQFQAIPVPPPVAGRSLSDVRKPDTPVTQVGGKVEVPIGKPVKSVKSEPATAPQKPRMAKPIVTPKAELPTLPTERRKLPEPQQRAVAQGEQALTEISQELRALQPGGVFDPKAPRRSASQQAAQGAQRVVSEALNLVRTARTPQQLAAALKKARAAERHAETILDRQATVEVPKHPEIRETAQEVQGALNVVKRQLGKATRRLSKATFLAKDKAEQGTLSRALKETQDAARELGRIRNAKTPEEILRSTQKVVRKAQQALKEVQDHQPPKGQAGRAYVPIDLRAVARYLKDVVVAGYQAMRKAVSNIRGRRERYAHQLLKYSSKATGGTVYRLMDGTEMKLPEVNSLLKSLKAGTSLVKSLKMPTWEWMEVTLKDGRKMKLWHPDAEGRFAELAKDLTGRRKWGETEYQVYDNNAADILYHWLMKAGPKLVSPFRAIGKLHDTARGINPKDPNSLTSAMDKFGRKAMGGAAREQFETIRKAWELMKQTKHGDEREIVHRLHELLKDQPDGGHSLSEAIFDAHQHGIRLEASEFGDAVVKEAYDLINARRRIFAWTAARFLEGNLIPKETVEAFAKNENYLHWTTDKSGNRVKGVNMTSVLAQSFMHHVGARSILDPVSITNALGSYLKKRTQTDYAEAKRRGLIVDYQSQSEAAYHQIVAASKLDLYERVRDGGLVREGPPAEEVAYAKRQERLVESLRRMDDFMAQKKWPMEFGLPEQVVLRKSRVAARRKLDLHRARMVKYGIPTSGPAPWARSKRDVARVEKYQADLEAMENSYWKTLHLPRRAHTQQALLKDMPQPTRAPDDALVKAMNEKRAYIKNEIFEMEQYNRRWMKVPAKMEFGALVKTTWKDKTKLDKKTGKEEVVLKDGKPVRVAEVEGNWIPTDIWNEIEHMASETHAVGRLYDSAHLLRKKLATVWRTATGTGNFLGNVRYNGTAGQYQSHPKTVQLHWDAFQAMFNWQKTGKLKMRDPAQQAFADEFVETGIMGQTAPNIDLARISGEVSEAFDAAKLARSDGRWGEASAHFGRGVMTYMDQFYSKAPGTKHMMDFYYATDTAFALSLYVARRGNIGSSIGKPLEVEQAFRPIDMWYNYTRTPLFLRSKWGRRLFSFTKFKWKAMTSKFHTALYEPAPLLPGIVASALPKEITLPGGRKINPQILLAPRASTLGFKGPRAQALSAGTTSAMVLSLKMLKQHWGKLAALYAFKQWSGMSDEDYEKYENTITQGGGPDKYFTYPVPGLSKDEPYFFQTLGLDTYSHMVTKAETERDQDAGVATKLANWLLDQSIALSASRDMVRGVNYFGDKKGDASAIWNVGVKQLIPGTAEEALRYGYRQITGTRRTIGEDILKLMGLKLRKAHVEDIPYELRRQLIREGKAKEIQPVLVVPVDDADPMARMYLNHLNAWIEMNRKMRVRK